MKVEGFFVRVSHQNSCARTFSTVIWQTLETDDGETSTPGSMDAWERIILDTTDGFVSCEKPKVRVTSHSSRHLPDKIYSGYQLNLFHVAWSFPEPVVLLLDWTATISWNVSQKISYSKSNWGQKYLTPPKSVIRLNGSHCRSSLVLIHLNYPIYNVVHLDWHTSLWLIEQEHRLNNRDLSSYFPTRLIQTSEPRPCRTTGNDGAASCEFIHRSSGDFINAWRLAG